MQSISWQPETGLPVSRAKENAMADLKARTETFCRHYGALMHAGVAEGRADAAALADCFAPYFVASSPQGVFGGEGGETFRTVIGDGVENYRRMGGTDFIVEGVEVIGIDPLHVMARVSWRFDYKRPQDGRTGTIRFANQYFITFADGDPKIFGWVTPDEHAVLKEHGLM
jgi:hypothetical protein